MEKQQAEFKKMKTTLKKEGYREKDVTFTAKQATLIGTLYSLPCIAILGFVCRFF